MFRGFRGDSRCPDKLDRALHYHWRLFLGTRSSVLSYPDQILHGLLIEECADFGALGPIDLFAHHHTKAEKRNLDGPSLHSACCSSPEVVCRVGATYMPSFLAWVLHIDQLWGGFSRWKSGLKSSSDVFGVTLLPCIANFFNPFQCPAPLPLDDPSSSFGVEAENWCSAQEWALAGTWARTEAPTIPMVGHRDRRRCRDLNDCWDGICI